MNVPNRRTSASERGSDPTVGDNAGTPIPDLATLRAEYLARARMLGRRVGAQVMIDETGWLRSEVELVFTRGLDRTLRPVMVRVGRDATDDAVMADGGVLASCDQYNAALVRLHRLAARLTHLVRRGRVRLDPGSPAGYAHLQLSRLDELIDRRQRITMGHGVVQLVTLRRETEFLMRCDAHLAPIVEAASGATRQPLGVRRWIAWWRTRHGQPTSAGCRVAEGGER